MVGAELWWNRPLWLADLSKWPAEIVMQPSEESNAERKVQHELLAVGVKINYDFDTLREDQGNPVHGISRKPRIMVGQENAMSRDEYNYICQRQGTT